MNNEPSIQIDQKPAPSTPLRVNCRRNGNVARLPKILRDKVNQMLEDGILYADIIAELQKSTNPPLPHSISADNISNWKQGGYQDYLRAKDWRDRMTICADRFLDPAESDPIQLASGALHTAMIQVCELMDQISQAKADDTDPQKFVGVANALSRISRSIVIIQEFRDAVARAKAAEPTSDEAQAKARKEMLDKMDVLFGIRPAAAIDRIFGPATPEPSGARESSLAATSSDNTASNSPSETAPI